MSQTRGKMKQSIPPDSIQKPTDQPAGGHRKKPFVAPKLTRHETLPEVTTGFIGTFSP